MVKVVKCVLAPVSVRNLGPGRYADGNGLYLAVADTGARSWIWRGVIQGRRRELGLGGVSYVSLKEARETARQWKRLAREGGDPAVVRDKEKRSQLTFADAATQCWSARVDGKMRSARTAETWLNPLTAYVSPRLGKRVIGSITTADVAAVLAPIWSTKAHTGRKVRQRLSMIFDWARASGHLEGPNPVEGVNLSLPRQTDRQRHFAALPWKDMPALWPRLEAAPGMGALALRFIILTAARTGEARGATWGEIDFDNALWSVPAARMKAERPHRVPLELWLDLGDAS